MRKPGLRNLGIPFALSCLFLFPQVAVGELTARLVADPKPVGLHVTVHNVTFERNSLAAIDLTLGNYSGNLLTINAARSSLVGPDGDAHQLSSVVAKGFTSTLLPGAGTSCTIRSPVFVKRGDVLKVFLVWTLGAVSASATWVWEIAEVAPPVQRITAAYVGPPTPATVSAVASQPTSAERIDGDTFLGVIGLVLGLALLALVGWGLWTLRSLLW